MKHVEFEGYAGENIKDIVCETFDWFYTSENINTESVTIRHLNGVKVTFEWEKR
jgi:hypothetical protein